MQAKDVVREITLSSTQHDQRAPVYGGALFGWKIAAIDLGAQKSPLNHKYLAFHLTKRLSYANLLTCAYIHFYIPHSTVSYRHMCRKLHKRKGFESWLHSRSMAGKFR